MKIFVASWFYVPVTTSEALVTYKLLSNSENEYVVCSAKSNKWSYNKNTELISPNIKQIIIDTEDFDVFVDEVVEKYKELSKTETFDAIMTRSLPPESQLIGFKIKEFDKNIPWIASLADPIGNNPYETSFYFLQNRHKIVRRLYYNAPHFFLDKICPLIRKPNFQNLSKLYKLERRVLKDADVIITPGIEQAEYIFNDETLCKEKSMVVPHSFDKKLYQSPNRERDERFTFTFIGHSDSYRSVEPIVRSMVVLRDHNPEMFEKIKIRLIGNIPTRIKDMVYVYFLQDVVSIEEPCDYFESLKIMQESDCLIHIDAWFDILKNGSIFFAAKIVDYLGAGKPILGLTGEKSPAGKIISACGGLCASFSEYDIVKKMVKIVSNPPHINQEEADKYLASNVAQKYDEDLRKRIKKNG